MKKLTFEEFRNEILESIEELPSSWRYGQKVFNYIDSAYGVARDVQFFDNIDCFYNDEYVDSFIKLSYDRWISYHGENKDKT